MVITSKIIKVFITKEFVDEYENFISLVDRDPEFKEILKQKKDKVAKKNGTDSLKIRYIISKFVESQLKKELEELDKN